MGREDAMRVVSINVGLPSEVLWRGKPITTAIFKRPVTGPVRVRSLNLDGDGQADLRVHGGAEKAVYAYSCRVLRALAEGAAGARLPLGAVRREPDDRRSRGSRRQHRRPLPSRNRGAGRDTAAPS